MLFDDTTYKFHSGVDSLKEIFSFTISNEFPIIICLGRNFAGNGLKKIILVELILKEDRYLRTSYMVIILFGK